MAAIGARGNPVIAGNMHRLVCEIYAEPAADDRLIVIGESESALQLNGQLPSGADPCVSEGRCSRMSLPGRLLPDRTYLVRGAYEMLDQAM